MSRIIDADKIGLRVPYSVDGNGDILVPLSSVRQAIAMTPTEDVEKVRHGEWEQNQYCKRIYYCSKCGRHIEDCTNNPNEHFPYCHCGAKMDGGKEQT